MKTHFKNLATAVVLYIVVLAESCSKKNIDVPPIHVTPHSLTDDERKNTQRMQASIASQANGEEIGEEIEVVNGNSQEEQQENPDTGLQGNNNLVLRPNKRNNLGLRVLNNSINQPSSGQQNIQSLLQSLRTRKRDTERLKQEEEKQVGLLQKDMQQIGENLTNKTNSRSYGARGVHTEQDIKQAITNLTNKVLDRKEKLVCALAEINTFLQGINGQKNQYSSGSEEQQFTKRYNTIVQYQKDLCSYENTYHGLKGQLEKLDEKLEKWRKGS